MMSGAELWKVVEPGVVAALAALTAVVTAVVTTVMHLRIHGRRARRKGHCPHCGRLLGLAGTLALPWLAMAALVFGAGCAGLARTRGGQAADGAGAVLVQSDDPKQASRQVGEHVRERTFTLAKGTVIHREISGNGLPAKAGTTNEHSYIEDLVLGADTMVAERSSDRVESSLGAAQRNMAGEIGGKLAKAWPIMVTGCALLAGAAALFYFGWYTKGAIAVGCAVLCFVLYYVVPLHAGAIALGCLGLFAVLALLVLYVHFYTKGDVNRNWVPDVLEKNWARGDARPPEKP